MSHLSILPTVFTRLDLLEAALLDEGFQVSRQSELTVFDGAPCPVDLLFPLRDVLHPFSFIEA